MKFLSTENPQSILSDNIQFENIFRLFAHLEV